MLKLLPDFIKLPAVAILAVVLVFYPIRWFGQSEGRQQILAKMQSDRIKILQDGRQIDTRALGADDEALCALLGGCDSGGSE
jgi:hypothetical protein